MAILNKKRLFQFCLILYVLVYILLGNLFINTSSVDLDYKTFTESDSCRYTINQINFYDFEEASKSYQIYKNHNNFIKDIDSLRCVNKIQLIQDGWPVIRVEISGDSLLFQIIKNSGLIIIFIFFINFYPDRKKSFLFIAGFFNFITHLLFSIDFISKEFKFLYSYEIVFIEVLILYLIFLRHSNFDYLKKVLTFFQNFIYNINNKTINIISTLISIRAVYIFFTNTYSNNISDWLTNYSFGYIRRGFAGTILLAISNNLNFLAYTLLPFVIFFLHYFVTYNSLKIFKESNKNIFSLFILLSPLFIFFPLFNVSKGVGNKELLGILCLLLIFRSTYNQNQEKYLLPIIILFIVSVFSHEVNLFILPSLFLLSYFKIIHIHKKLLIFLSSIVLIFVGVYFLFPVSSETINSLCSDIYLLIENLDCTKAYYLNQNGSNSIYSSIDRMFEDSDYIMVYGIYLILGLTPFLVDGFIKKNYKLFLLVLLGFLPLFIVAIDWGRWLNLLIFTLSGIYFVTARRLTHKSLDLSNAILIILYSTLWRVPQCCVEEINLTYLLRFDKYNFLIYIFLIYIITTRKKERVNKINEFIKF
jgi:hypothetical protein